MDWNARLALHVNTWGITKSTKYSNGLEATSLYIVVYDLTKGFDQLTRVMEATATATTKKKKKKQKNLIRDRIRTEQNETEVNHVEESARLRENWTKK